VREDIREGLRSRFDEGLLNSGSPAVTAAVRCVLRRHVGLASPG
jgi:hypothetical protein